MQIGGTVLSNPVSGTSLVVVGVAIAAVVLLLTFGSLTAAGLPLLTAGTGVGISVAAIVALGSALGLSTTTRTLALMLGLAVGIDYALLIVSRYREELARDQAPQEAAARAVGTAGTAVAFAGLTVIITLAGLSLVGIPLLTKMGPHVRETLAISAWSGGTAQRDHFDRLGVPRRRAEHPDPERRPPDRTRAPGRPERRFAHVKHTVGL